MKSFFAAALAFFASTVTASAITVASPANGAQVTSPFTVSAATDVCGGVPAVSMGYSLDHNSATIEPTDFSAVVEAAPGAHVLHVKCWGKKTNEEVLLNVNVAAAGPSSDLTVSSPAANTDIISPFNVAAYASVCGSSPAASMSYSIDGSHPVTQPVPFSKDVTANNGSHTLTIRCTGQNGRTDQASMKIHVIPPPLAATPVLSLATAKYATKQVLSISDATPGATIHYTVNGSTPTAASPEYTGPLSIATTTPFAAVAVAPGYSTSKVASAVYTIVPPSGPSIPANAIKQTQVQLTPNWRIKHDPATPGSASGAISVVDDPSLSGQTNRFTTSFTNEGGVLYSVTYGNDTTSHNFVYDAMVRIEGGSTLGSLEMDNNQVTADGTTIIYAFQCSGFSGTWEYSANIGTTKDPIVKWMPSGAPCNPQAWSQDTWHHVQISYSRDDAGNVTYHSVWLDGAEEVINKTVKGSFSLGWARGVLVSNFQVDGKGPSGGSTLYLDNLTIYRW